MKNRGKIGIGLILVGVGVLLISLFNADGYEPGLGGLYNIQNMYITIADPHPVSPAKLQWKYVTAEEVARRNEVGGILSRDLLGGDRELLKKDPRQFAENIQSHFHSDMTLEDIEKAVISGKRMKLAKKEWEEAVVIQYKYVATISGLLVLVGIAFLIFRK
jgi:hypothetical protein